MVNPKGRPKVDNPNKIIKTIRLSEEMIQRIDDYGKKNNLSFGKVVRQALDEFLSRK